jgi:hypothetical protein
MNYQQKHKTQKDTIFQKIYNIVHTCTNFQHAQLITLHTCAACTM